MRPKHEILRGRGASDNPPNRFERTHFEREPQEDEGEATPAPATQTFRDATRTIIATNDSPDVGFDASINPYRGCEHGCIYCYARPTHEYLGFSAGLDFETKILVKEDAAELLQRELSSPRWAPKPIALSGVTDPYQPLERRLRITRGCLEVLARFRNPVVIITKNRLVIRDLDLLADLARCQAAAVFLSITTLDAALARVMEPRTSPPVRRLEAIRRLSQAGVPAGVMVGPVIPGLTDHELPAILAAAAHAGARRAGYSVLRLPWAVGPLFERWLQQHVPDRKERVLGRLRSIRGGPLNDPRFGARMRGHGPFVALIARMFAVACERAGLNRDPTPLSTAAFRRPGDHQLALFE
jgi:DNA repair photolyase